MWYKLGKKIIQYKLAGLILLGVITTFMAWQTSKIQLSYEANKAVPDDNPVYIEYKKFAKQFAADNHLVVIGIESKNLFTPAVFNAYSDLHQRLEKITAVREVTSVVSASNLVKDTANSKFASVKIFTPPYTAASLLDSQTTIFKSVGAGGGR